MVQPPPFGLFQVISRKKKEEMEQSDGGRLPTSIYRSPARRTTRAHVGQKKKKGGGKACLKIYLRSSHCGANTTHWGKEDGDQFGSGFVALNPNSKKGEEGGSLCHLYSPRGREGRWCVPETGLAPMPFRGCSAGGKKKRRGPTRRP